MEKPSKNNKLIINSKKELLKLVNKKHPTYKILNLNLLLFPINGNTILKVTNTKCKHPEYTISTYNFLNNGIICPKCYNRNNAHSKKNNTGKNYANALKTLNNQIENYKDYKIVDFNKKDYENNSIDNTYVTFQHNRCGNNFQTTIKKFKKGSMCPNCCVKNKKTSKLEKMLYQYIRSIYKGKIIKHWKFPNDNNGYNEIDIYLPSLYLGIEVNGLYFHSNLFKNQLYHYNKTETLDKMSIKLLHISDVDVLKQPKLIKNIISKEINKTNKKTLTFEGNLLTSRKIDESELISFINDYCKIYNNTKLSNIIDIYGTFYKDELVSIFYTYSNIENTLYVDSKLYINVCYFENPKYNIINGYLELEKLFINNCGYSSDLNLLMSLDRRYFTKRDIKDGYKFECYTQPNKFYYNESYMEYYTEEELESIKNKINNFSEDKLYTLYDAGCIYSIKTIKL